MRVALAEKEPSWGDQSRDWVKEIMYKEWKEIIGIISHQMQNISRDRNYILKVLGKEGGS